MSKARSSQFLGELQRRIDRYTYPPKATVDEHWSDFREAGKSMVADLVRRHGNDVIKRIPLQWRQYDAVARQEGTRPSSIRFG